MRLFHISHTDLDGYGCQLLTKECFKEGFFLNANYGQEVKMSIQTVLEEIAKCNKDDVILFFITDVNLTTHEANDLDKKVTELKSQGFKIKLQLLDHHATGQTSADRYDWYYLDISRCATKITYDYLIEKVPAFNKEENAWISPLVDCINAVDIWLEDQTANFEFGKVLLSMVSKVREVNNVLFASKNREFRIHLLKEAAKYIGKQNDYILLDNDIHSIKKEYLKLDDKDDSLDNLSAMYLVDCLENIKEELTVTYQGHKGILTYCLGGISIPANAFLKANKDFDFFIDVNKKGNMSLRADGKVDVSKMAMRLANGGGHKNASGCKLEDFKENIHYEVINLNIQERLNKI